MSKKSYVYISINWDTEEFYIGSRGVGSKNPKNDGYYGSGKWPSMAKKNKSSLDKIILGFHPTRKAAWWDEQRLIYLLCGHPLCRNEHNTNGRKPK